MTLANLPPLDPLQRYTYEEARQYLRISRAFFYRKVANGDIKTIRDGHRAFVPGAELVAASRVPA